MPMPGDSKTPPKAPFTYGTIHVSGLDASGGLYGCTSTSGLSYKIPGRAGDSPIVGAGIYTDNLAGSAGATGRGESSLHNCAAYETVRLMEQGRLPAEAAVETLRRMAARTKEGRLLASEGVPSFNVTIYALRKDGEVGCASMHDGYQYVTQQGDECRICTATPVFRK